MWPFRRQPFLSGGKADWIEAHFDWINESYGPNFIQRRTLILPTRDFFTAGRGADHGAAQAVFAEVAAYLDIAEPIELVPQFSVPDEWSHGYDQLSQKAGSFAFDGNSATITYDPKLLSRPIAFISTIAHELMHYRIAGLIDLLPGGEETHEHATDLHCIIWGFGVFQLQAADDLGWAGYLDQSSRAYALALFLTLADQDASVALVHLAPRPAKLLRKALADRKRWDASETGMPD